MVVGWPVEWLVDSIGSSVDLRRQPKNICSSRREEALTTYDAWRTVGMSEPYVGCYNSGGELVRSGAVGSEMPLLT